MVEIKTFWQAVEEPLKNRQVEPVSKEPSLTIQEGYESLDEMIPRIIRGEVKSIPMVYEYGDADDDEILDSPVVDDLDDLTDIDISKEIMTSAVASAQANTTATAEDSKHGAEVVKEKEATQEEKHSVSGATTTA